MRELANALPELRAYGLLDLRRRGDVELAGERQTPLSPSRSLRISSGEACITAPYTPTVGVGARTNVSAAAGAPLKRIITIAVSSARGAD